MKIFKKIISVVLVATIALALASCSGTSSKKTRKRDRDRDRDRDDDRRHSESVTEYDADEVRRILIDELGVHRDDIRMYESEDRTIISVDYDSAYFSCYIYSDEDDAHDVFDDYYDRMTDDYEDDYFDGIHSEEFTSSNGYLVFDGEGTDEDAQMFVDEDYYYGGSYYFGSMVITIFTTADADGAREDVEEVISAFNLISPTAQRH